jgi:6-phosphofructokinase 1
MNIGIMTSGGDSPAMNAAIRAAVRTAIHLGFSIYGIKRGYQGMIEGDIKKLETTDVANIIHRGGTILKTARSKQFRTPEGMQMAYEQLQKHNINALVLIGGDGTFSGAVEFFKSYSIPAIGLPGTIDKDLAGTDYTIGFDTAVNTAIDAIDKIRDTAEAHDRVFIVEVMGRDAGYIALHSGISCGAEHIFIPEHHETVDHLIDEINFDQKRKKLTNIIVVAEGDETGGAIKIQNLLTDKMPNLETRVSILGHIQRGGSPTCADRILASRLGYAAVHALAKGRTQEMVGIVNNEVTFTPFAQCIKTKNPMPADMIDMISVLSK